ncbi:MAG: radical SAM protein [Candidatus Brocadia sp.]|nr:radical SAM protein [Candidatus Brocadia sp.]
MLTKNITDGMRNFNKNHETKKLGMVQINNSFSGQNYLPYSLGFLQGYAQRHLKDIGKFEFLLPIYKRIPVKVAVERLSDADMVFFSTYVWNIRISLEIARQVKQKRPETIIVFGGMQVPNIVEPFLRNNPFVDVVCHGEGEIPFLNILENCTAGDWRNIPSISFIDENDQLVQNKRCERISNLNTIPSPYLAGVFDRLMETYSEEHWIVLWETNRGCPFSCSYCDWGAATHARVYTYDIKRIFEEVDWFSDLRIEFIYCCDANFGILKRDIEIVKYVAANKKKYGYPKALSVQNTKNSTERSYEIQKILSDAGLNKGVTLSLQSMNKATLKSVNRQNISISAFQELQHKFTDDNVETYTDIILALPEETYETFTEGVSYVIENGQHNRIQFNNLSLLPNAEMGNPEYQKKYDFVVRETKIINVHGSLGETDEIYETQHLVVGTNTMPLHDWVKARVFSWMTSFLHFDKVLQIPLLVLHTVCSIKFKDLIEIFTKEATSPVLSEINKFFVDKALDIQNGGAEYCESKEWLDIWWPADELMLIKLCTENKLDLFYAEAAKILERSLVKQGLDMSSDLLHESVSYNRNLMKLPFQKEDISVELSYNIWEMYRASLKGKSALLEKGKYHYLIDRSSFTWSSWEDWCREVIWYGNKKGAYLYRCKQLSPHHEFQTV